MRRTAADVDLSESSAEMIKKVLKKIYSSSPHTVRKRLKTIAGDRRPRPAQTFKYEKPAGGSAGSKEIALLCRQDTIRGAVHVIREGAEEHLHSHKTIDGFWMVLKGRARFHGENGAVMGEFDPMEGILVPRNTRYWFESIGEQDLEMLQVVTSSEGGRFDRDDHAKPNFNRENVKWVDCRDERKAS